jgi:hypothetical protein
MTRTTSTERMQSQKPGNLCLPSTRQGLSGI